jgi:hypothetical protein
MHHPFSINVYRSIEAHQKQMYQIWADLEKKKNKGTMADEGIEFYKQKIQQCWTKSQDFYETRTESHFL